MADQAEVLRFAEAHGAKKAADHFHLPPSTVRSWRSRVRKRAGRQAAESFAGPDTPAGRFQTKAELYAAWAASGHRLCIQCGGAGTVTVPAVQRHGQTLQPERAIPCPSCPAQGRAIVTEHPATVDGEWAQGMATFGDLTANLREREAAKLLPWHPPGPMPEHGPGGRSPFQTSTTDGRFSPLVDLAERAAEQRRDRP